MDGAEGDDTVLVDFDLDLAGLDGGVTNVERIDLSDGTLNRLFLGLDDVLAITDEADTPFVAGDGAAATGSVADAACLVGDWTSGPALDGFVTFTLASAAVSVDTEMTTDVVVA